MPRPRRTGLALESSPRKGWGQPTTIVPRGKMDEMTRKFYDSISTLALLDRKSLGREQGWTVDKVYTDPGISGTTSDWPRLQAALADCEARRIDVLLTHRLDRFYRNLDLQRETMKCLERWDIGYVSPRLPARSRRIPSGRRAVRDPVGGAASSRRAPTRWLSAQSGSWRSPCRYAASRPFV